MLHLSCTHSYHNTTTVHWLFCQQPYLWQSDDEYFIVGVAANYVRHQKCCASLTVSLQIEQNELQPANSVNPIIEPGLTFFEGDLVNRPVSICTLVATFFCFVQVFSLFERSPIGRMHLIVRGIGNELKEREKVASLIKNTRIRNGSMASSPR